MGRCLASVSQALQQNVSIHGTEGVGVEVSSVTHGVLVCGRDDPVRKAVDQLTQLVRRRGRVCDRLADLRNLLGLELGVFDGVLEQCLSGEVELPDGIVQAPVDLVKLFDIRAR